MERVSNFIGKAITRATQRTVRFIRWLRGYPLQPRGRRRLHDQTRTRLVPEKILNFSTPIDILSGSFRFKVHARHLQGLLWLYFLRV